MMPNKPLLRAESLCRHYKIGSEIVRALDDVTLDIYEGEFVAIVGSSGSGKSTLLYLLGGMDRPTSGKIFINDEQIDKLGTNALARFRQRTIGYIFQRFHLIATMTALRNVELPMVFAGITPHKRHERAKELLTLVGLGDRIHHRPTELSGGQQQRVAIARALVNEPKIILADEPTGNLDSKSGGEIIEALKALNAQGRTVLMVTHDNSLLQVTSRFVRMRDGKIIERSE